MSTTTQNLLSAKIVDRYLLSKTGSTKKTYHIVLKLPSPIEYKVGDSVAIYPINSEIHVDNLLSLLPETKEILHKKTREPHNLKEYLLKNANLSKIPSTLIKLLAQKSSCKKLLFLLMSENKSSLAAYLQERELLDILKEYPNFLSTQEIIDHLLPMLPRYYSIASSSQKDPNHIHLTVGHVVYSSLGKQRVGIGSHFLCELACSKTTISFFVQPSKDFTLPNSNTPIIMIGPGTGIAPFRAFIEERMHTNTPGKNWLFFGERNGKTDFYYEEFFSSLEKDNKLKLSTAFSRDQKEKIYVQHKMLENAEEFFSWLEDGAVIYVCGDAKKMAKDVNEALLQIVSTQKNLSSEEAKTYLKTLRKEKRYLTDVY